MKTNFTSIGFNTKCQCGELSKWELIDVLGNVTYVCERCFKRDWEGK